MNSLYSWRSFMTKAVRAGDWSNLTISVTKLVTYMTRLSVDSKIECLTHAKCYKACAAFILIAVDC